VLERSPVRTCIDIVKRADEADAMVAELFQGVGESVFRGPARVAEQIRRSPGPECHQPVSAIHRWAEHGISSAQAAERVGQISRAGLGDVAPDQRDTAAAIAPERSSHAMAEAAVPLLHTPDSHQQAEARSVGRDCQHDIETAAAAQAAQQGGQRRDMKAQGGAITDVMCEAALHGS
jgi:hypothetical protein